MPLDAALDLLDQALTALMDASGSDLSRGEVALATAAVGRLVAAVDQLIQIAERTGFAEFLRDHPELF